MTLYRAIYQRPAPTSTLRGMTFAARDGEQAGRIAEDWQLSDTLLVVKPVRALQPVLALEG